MAGPSLLNPSDPHPVRRYLGKSATSPFLLVGDHAGTAIPAALNDLGLDEVDRSRHIAVDIGVEMLGRALADRLGAVFLSQAYSRLVVDCNRHCEDPEWIAEQSDGTTVPGNATLAAPARQARFEEVYWPYHEAIARELDRREDEKIETILISLHSFTPTLAGRPRPWEIGVLHDGRRDRFALTLLKLLNGYDRLIGDNEPYRMDGTDYTIPHHAFPRGLGYVELEFRQDVLSDQVNAIAGLMAPMLEAAHRECKSRFTSAP